MHIFLLRWYLSVAFGLLSACLMRVELTRSACCQYSFRFAAFRLAFCSFRKLRWILYFIQFRISENDWGFTIIR